MSRNCKNIKCVRCINDSSVRRISFDNEHLCSYCRDYAAVGSKLRDRERLEQLFSERIESVRGKFTYDAAVGVSGGKDSIYVLYQLVRTYGLKVRAFTMNNGFLTDEARRNIDRITAELGVEHEYIEYDSSMLQRFYHYSMKKWLVPCIACSYIGYAAMINYTTKIDAGICVHGRSTEQMLRYYGNDVFTELVDAGLEHPESIDIPALYSRLLSGVEEKLDKGLKEEVRTMLFSDIKGDDFREFVAYFLYHPYDETQLVSFLKNNTSWQPHESHYDCSIHNAAKYIYQCAENRPHSLPEISALVRHGSISRETAEQRLQSELISAPPAEELKQLCRYAGVNKDMLMLKARLYGRLTRK